MSLAELSRIRAKIRQDLINNGTDVNLNDVDLYGDGDQSLLPAGDKVRQQVYRDLYASGGDVPYMMEQLQMTEFSHFAQCCISGHVEGVRECIENADTDAARPSQALVQLLEKRETTQRLSPLLMILSIGRSFFGLQGNRSLEAKQLEVVKLLLKYGARPDARDVCGKTVCHYGMGAIVTGMALKGAGFCVEAHKSSHLFGREVELHSLKNEELNGVRGVCRGYVVDTGRRAVYLLEKKETVGIKPIHLKLAGPQSTTDTDRPKLVDMQDRIGGVPLLETYMGGQADVADILLEEHHASIDIADVDGFSPRSMAMQRGAGFMTPVAKLINKHAVKRDRAEKKKNEATCSNCSKTGTSLSVCSKCQSTQYCCKECHVTHWRSGGHKEECPKLSREKQEIVVLERPPPDVKNTFQSTFQLGGGKFTSQPVAHASATFHKPSHVAVGEQFYIKIQAEGPTAPLLIYDKSREFRTSVEPSTPGFDALRNKVKSDPTSNGRKTYMKCSFDEQGRCTIYLGTRSAKTW
ncbi:hypothetical protein MPSEU_000140600 [Mayamaea pseudoterrestris]|nr:hypothetical protein MPSEU_000140600 [Mayamaea pseudoterrestris]